VHPGQTSRRNETEHTRVERYYCHPNKEGVSHQRSQTDKNLSPLLFFFWSNTFKSGQFKIDFVSLDELLDDESDVVCPRFPPADHHDEVFLFFTIHAYLILFQFCHIPRLSVPR
jgi:hypothetical protein